MSDQDLGFIPDAPASAPQPDALGFVPDGSDPSASIQPQKEDLGFIPDEPDLSSMKSMVKENLKAHKEKREPVDTSAPPVEAKDLVDAIAAGWGTSVSGLMIDGESARIQGFKDQGVMMDIASKITQLAGDFPAMVGGGALFGAAGEAVGGPGVAAKAALFGAGAVPATMRKVLMDHYDKGDITDKREFLNRLAATTWEAVKGGSVNVATFGAGKYAGAAAGPLAKTGAEIATMVGMSSALEGKMPDAKDFLTTGIVVGGVSASIGVASKLRNIYAASGDLPHESAEVIQKDITLKQQVLSENPDRPIEVTPAPPPPPEPGVAEKPSSWVEGYDNLRDKVKDSEASKYYQRSMDDLASLKMIRDKTIPEVAPGMDPFKLARIFKGVDGKTIHFERFGTIDFKTGDVNGESLEMVMKDLPDKTGVPYTESENKILGMIDPEDVKGKNESWGKAAAYRIAARVVEKEGQGISTGFDLEAAKEVVKGGKAEYGQWSDRARNYSARALKYLADSGAINKEEHQLMDRMNQEYIPFSRIMDDDPFAMHSGKTAQPRKMIGSERLIRDPFQVAQENAAAMVRMAEKQRIYQSLADLQVNAPEDAPQMLQKKPETMRPIELSSGELKKILSANGIDPSELSEESFKIFRPNRAGLQENEFSVKRNGKQEVWQVLPEYADALKAIDYRPGQANMLQKILMFPKKSLQTLTALSPDFILRNPFRDQFTSATQSKYGQTPFFEMTEALGHLMKKDDVFQEFLRSGGMSGGLDDINPYINGDLFKLEQETGFMSKTRNVINPVQALEAVSHMAEQIPRIMEFKRAGGVGGTYDQRVQAAFDARNVTVDFSRSGAAMRVLSQYVPFMNAGLQGTDTFMRVFTENPKKFAALAGAAITIPSILTWWNGHNDSRYKDAPGWMKNLFWVIPTNKWETAANEADFNSRPPDLRRTGQDGSLQVNNGVVLRLPKPFEVGVLFGSLPERILERYADHDPHAFEKMSDTITSAAIPNFAPPALMGPFEQFSNHSFFRDTDIVSPHAEQMLPQDRYSEYTSETAKQMAKVIGHMPSFISNFGSKATPLQAPAVIQNYIDLWGGTGGKYLVQIADGVLHAAGVGNTTPKAAWEWADAPFARAFVMKSPNPKSAPLSEFYTNYNFARQAMNSYKEHLKHGDIAGAQQIENEYGSQMLKANEVYKALNQANSYLNKINDSPKDENGKTFTPNDKLQLMTQTYYQMNQLAKAANLELDKIRKTIEDKKKGN